MGVKIRERKPGEWWLFIDHRGKRKAKKVGSKEAAEAAKTGLEEALGKKDLRLRTKAETVTVRQYAERWMKGHVAKNCKPATVEDYRDTLDRFILPEFGAVPIDELRRDEIKAFCFRLLDKKYPKGTDKITGETIYRNYSKTTAHHIVRVMSDFINHAIEDGLVAVNVAARPGRFVKLPKPGAKADVLTPEETDHLLETTKEHYPDLYPLLFTLFRTTLRKGEVRGLQWGDIDFHGQFLTVRRAFSKEVLSTPKSGEERNVEMGDRLLAVLSDHRRRCAAKALKRGRPLPTWVFSSREDRPMGDGTINDYLNRCLARAGLRHIRVHDTRHTVISQHLEAGTSLEHAKRMAGHSSIKLTSDTYGHKVRTTNREIANRLDRPENGTVVGTPPTYPQPAENVQNRKGLTT